MFDIKIDDTLHFLSRHIVDLLDFEVDADFRVTLIIAHLTINI